ncbi:Hint domain-containing protein [Roseicyclus sp.]|uniref:Hint domain-containing protein n=1 Tax=Roseicyclus sp. TaxID=1914329 RepID=UPI003F6A8680
MNALLPHQDMVRPAPIGGLDQWVAIWDAGQARIPPPRAPDPDPQPALSLLLEFCMPQVTGKHPLRLWQGAAEARRSIALYAQPDGALRLVHDEVDMRTEACFARPGEMIGLRYLCCARGRADVLELINHGRGHLYRMRLGIAQAVRLEEALPRHGGFLGVCHVAAIADFHVSSTDLPAVGAGALVQTTKGPIPVESLRPDMAVILTDGQAMPLRWVARRPRLCLGRLAPIRLRAPYFGLMHDIVTTPETRVARSGAAVEYLFGHERVLIRAGDMTSSPGARRDRQMPVRDMYHLLLDDHACVAIDRCGVESALLSDVIAAEDGGGQRNLSQTDRTPCLPVLDRAGAQALIAASLRGVGR